MRSGTYCALVRENYYQIYEYNERLMIYTLLYTSNKEASYMFPVSISRLSIWDSHPFKLVISYSLEQLENDIMFELL